ncbi:insulinase family protein [bacterium]|nr:insulinase family protein [bacterium]RQV96315.1 MAG: insulinase family protein [bacterium]
MKRVIIIMTILFIGFFFSCASVDRVPYAPEKIQPVFNLDESIPVNPEITVGQFENGLRYFIKENQKPENRALLRLVVNVGSVLEDEDQQGLAHFTEHMAFNGTKNFEKHELVDYLESIGMQFGPEINAYTGFDETVYMLEVPTDSVEIMEKAFQVLEDWAHQVSFEDEEIDKERGVIIEEWRQGRGAQARIEDQQYPILFQGSQYADRLPIGQMEVVDTCHYETLRRFYRDWYRPDLMAIIAVGDFDQAWIKRLIQNHFASIPLGEGVRERPVFPIPDHEETRFAIATDPEATQSNVSLYFKKELLPEQTYGDYRRLLVENLYDYMMNERLNELRQLPDPPYLYALSGTGRFVRSKGVYYLEAAVKNNGLEYGLETLLTEARRAKSHGFTQTELDRAKSQMLRYMEKAYLERDKTQSANYAAEITRHFLVDEPMPGIEVEYRFYQQFIPKVELDEINRLAGQTLTDHNRVILVDGPEKEDVHIPTEDELLAIFHNVKQKTVEPWADDVTAQLLVEVLPKPGDIVEDNRIEPLDVTEWKLSNGIRILLKPTDFKNDEISFTAFSPGGHSLAPDEDYISAITAISIIGESGLGQFDEIALGKKLAGKIVNVSPFIGSLTEGISGSGSVQDIETLFQLIYLYFTSPRRDSTAFLSFKNRMKLVIENRNSSPESAYSDTIQVTMAQYHPRSRPWTLNLLEEMDLNRSFQIYRERFADASDFTFIFVGNIDLEMIKPFILTYIGGLPSMGRDEMWRDVGVEPPKGIIHKTVRRGIEPKASVRIIFTGPYEWKRQNNYDIGSMSSLLRIKLRESLREDLGGTYGVGVGSSTSHFPKEEYTLSISFGCSPERVGELIETVFIEIDSLKTVGPREVDVNKVREAQTRQYELDLKDNVFWQNALYTTAYHGSSPLNILDYMDYVNNLSAESIQNAAKKYFDMNNYVQFVLLPEGTEKTQK